MTGQSFLTELQKLLNNTPSRPAKIINCENCVYCDYLSYCKNCTFCFDTANSNDCVYVYDSYMVVNSVDSDYIVECDSCYECVDAFKCFNCSFLDDGTNMTDSSYCYYCINCTNVFGCAGLKNKSYCIFNRQFTQQEYEAKVAELKTKDPKKILAVLEELKKTLPLTQAASAHNENSPYGNHTYHNKNCYMSFDASHNTDCGYLYDSFYNTSCFDMTQASRYNEHSYEIINSEKMNGCAFAIECSNCQGSSYIFNSKGLKDCLGCVGLNYKQYCILNRQLDEETYKKLSQQILQDLNQMNPGWGTLRFT